MSRLIDAAYEGNTEEVIRLLNSGVDINEIKKGYCCNWSFICSYNGVTPLYWAARNGHYLTLKVLVERGADVNVTDEYGETGLHWAAIHGYTEITALLLNYGANIHIANADGETALHRATIHGHRDIVDMLIEADKRLTIKLTLEAAAAAANMTTTTIGATGNTTTGTFLVAGQGQGMGSGQQQQQQQQVPRGRSSESFASTALIYAADYGHTEIVYSILTKPSLGVNANKTDSGGRSALFRAAIHGHNDIAKLLVDYGSDLSAQDFEEGNTALHVAAYYGHEYILQLLLHKGCSANTTNNLARTPLYFAAMNGHVVLVQCLLDCGAYVEMPPDAPVKTTPLHVAARGHHFDVALLLVQHGADLWCCDETGLCALDLVTSPQVRAVLEVAAVKRLNWMRRREMTLFLYGSGLLQPTSSSLNPFNPLHACLSKVTPARLSPTAPRATATVLHNPDLLVHMTRFL